MTKEEIGLNFEAETFRIPILSIRQIEIDDLYQICEIVFENMSNKDNSVPEKLTQTPKLVPEKLTRVEKIVLENFAAKMSNFLFAVEFLLRSIYKSGCERLISQVRRYLE